MSSARINSIFAYAATRWPTRAVRLRSWRYDGGSIPHGYDSTLGPVQIEDYSLSYLGAPDTGLEEPYTDDLSVRVSVDGASEWVDGSLFPAHASEPFSQWVMNARYVHGLAVMPEWSAMHTEGLRL